ncbi:MAG: hypothetical protein ACK42H_07190 [Planctomycetota bacterium]|jgi:hypothetical protein
MGVYGLGRPAKADVRVFQRNLDEGQRAILLAAGGGDMSAGWLEVLDAYQHLHSLGYRPGMDLSKAILVLPLGDQENASEAR